ncbi:TPA: iron-containing alcohol dehydrogenase [Legionella pneumophila]|nr:iron-containing alcohol dehydrogenase [Legionella pneumophila]
MKNQSLIVNWNYPTRILVGAGRINELAKACRELGMNAPLLVTDPGLASSLMVSKVIQQAQASGLRTGLFCQIKTNPTGDNVMNGVCAFKAGQHDGVIAFGGGSALDAGKAIALMVGQDRPLWDFEDVGDNWTRVNVSAMAPVLAIPTTAGTGSEVGRASVITDAEKQVKKIIFHPKMLPAMVILDPELTVGLPKLLTAATGMDALSHCLEAYCSNYYHPMAEGIALEGIRLIKENLIQAYKDGSDLEARTHMLVASAMGATAFQRGLGAMHALAHPLGAIYDIHHGRLNAVLMPYVLLANRSEIENKIERLANYLSIANGFDGFLNWIEQMRLELGIENTLSQLGIDHSQIDRLAKMATEDAAAASNTVLFTFEQYKELLSKAIGE